MRKRQLIYTTLSLALLAILVPQCKHEPIRRKIGGQDTITPPPPPPPPEDTTICFERDILPLFVSNCAKSGCHDSATHKEGLRLNSYQGIRYAKDQGILPGNPDASNIFVKIQNGEMNNVGSIYGNLNSAQVALIRRWIKEGAQNGSNCPGKCDSTKFTYSGAVAPLLQKKCVGCHTGPAAGGGIKLDTHADVKAVVDNGKLWGAINGISGFSFMPKGGAKLSDCELKQIQKWIQNGATNN